MVRILIVSVTAGLMLVAGYQRVNAADRPASIVERCWTPDQRAPGKTEHMTLRRRVQVDKGALRARTPSPARAVPEGLRGSIRRVELPAGKKLVALTFDLCETPYSIAGYDGGIVDFLREHEVRATFFASGKWLETHGERAQQLIADPNFEVGNHGLEHRDFRRVRGAGLTEEIALAQAAYERGREQLMAHACLVSPPGTKTPAVPRAMTLFRFPYGTCDAAALKAVADQGLLAIQWDVVTGDPERGRSARAIAATVLSRVKPGSIVIAHANGRGWNTAAALPLILPKLKAQGYEFVTVGELLAAGKPVVAKSCYQLHPGDNRNLHSATLAKQKPESSADSDQRALLHYPD